MVGDAAREPDWNTHGRLFVLRRPHRVLGRPGRFLSRSSVAECLLVAHFDVCRDAAISPELEVKQKSLPLAQSDVDDPFETWTRVCGPFLRRMNSARIFIWLHWKRGRAEIVVCPPAGGRGSRRVPSQVRRPMKRIVVLIDGTWNKEGLTGGIGVLLIEQFTHIAVRSSPAAKRSGGVDAPNMLPRTRPRRAQPRA
jgi:hypothetical protein